MSRSDSDAAGDRCGPGDGQHDSRRGFLKKVGALSAAAVVAAGAADVPAAPQQKPKLPQIRLGRYSISRLICGNNCFGAGSHLSVFVNHEMRSYYTPEQILKTLTRCQQEGINCWQAGSGSLELYRRLCDEGGKMHFLALGAGNRAEIDKLARGGCIAVAHHGEVTDQLFKRGDNDFLVWRIRHPVVHDV